jgi:regulator of sigma E protease
VGPLAAIGHGLISTVETTGTVILGLRSLIRRELPMKEAGYGPLGIATLVGEQAKTHFVNLLSILGMISINLAVINLVPFPALDGGRTAFVLLEVVLGWFRRKPVDRRTEAYIHLGGFVLLMMLLLALTANDLLRMVSSP